MKKYILLFVSSGFFFLVQAQSWSLTGNGGINPAVNFIGTTNNASLRFRVSNVYAGEIDSVTTKTFLGFGAGRNTTTGINNAAFGFKSLYSNTTGSYNTAYGKSALFQNTTGGYNTACGGDALIYNTTGTRNSALGVSALAFNSTGNYNTASGVTALYNNTTGSFNTAAGLEALYYNTNGNYNTATGADALLYNSTGSYNTASGISALLKNTSGSLNTATGSHALSNNTTGDFSSAFGRYALLSNIAGGYNAGFGAYTLFSCTNSFYNTAVGMSAGDSYNLGWNNTLIGAFSDANGAGLYNCVALGESATCTGSSQARIGNSSTISIGGYTGWTNISDSRVKKNIQDNVPGLAFINKLKPVTYNLDLDAADKIAGSTEKKDKDGKIIPVMPFETDARKQKEQIVYTGFLAQDVEKAAKEINYDFSGVDAARNDKDLYGLRYAEFVVPLVKAVQEQQQIIADLEARIIALEKKAGNNGPSSNNTADLFNVWPNPSHDMVTLNIVSNSGSQVWIKVFDSKGALVKQQRSTILQGSNQLNIDMKGLAAGTYHLSGEWNNGQVKKTVQIVKQ